MAALGSAAQLRNHDLVSISCKFVSTFTLKKLFKNSFKLYKRHMRVYFQNCNLFHSV